MSVLPSGFQPVGKFCSEATFHSSSNIIYILQLFSSILINGIVGGGLWFSVTLKEGSKAKQFELCSVVANALCIMPHFSQFCELIFFILFWNS